MNVIKNFVCTFFFIEIVKKEFLDTKAIYFRKFILNDTYFKIVNYGQVIEIRISVHKVPVFLHWRRLVSDARRL